MGVTGDPVLRQQLARAYTHERVETFVGRRAAELAREGTPGPEGSLGKLLWTNGMKLNADVVSSILGAALIADTGEWGTFAWGEHVLGAPGYRIAGGSDEVQRNIIGERVLGLPPEPRVDKGVAVQGRAALATRGTTHQTCRRVHMPDDETFHHRDRCAISGIGCTDFSRSSGRSDLTLATQASLAAIADAGLTPQDIDGIVRCDMDLVRANDLVDALGMDGLDYYGDAGPGGVAPCAQVAQAVAAIISGQATNVLVYRSLNGRSGRRYGLSSVTAAKVGGNGTYDEFFLPYGLLTPGQIFGLIAQRHMIDFGTTEKDLGAIAIACRNRANANPRAQMHDRALSMDDYLAARMIARPLRLFDFCLETDGAAALVVTSTERAKDGPNPPALIRAVAAGSLRDPQPGIQFPVVLRDPLTTLPAKPTADTLYRRAGLGPADIDAAQLYDCFTITVLLQLEDYGFCAKGEGGAFVSSGAIELGGTLPINTGGGHLSEGYIHGMNHIVEGVRQIRGTSTGQVEGAETCLVTNTPLPPGSALILRRDG